MLSRVPLHVLPRVHLALHDTTTGWFEAQGGFGRHRDTLMPGVVELPDTTGESHIGRQEVKTEAHQELSWSDSAQAGLS